MTNAKGTPLQAARAYAAEHPEWEGELVVKSRRKSRAGRTEQYNRAWVRDGRAALIQTTWIGGRINGQCVACGHVFPEAVLGEALRRFGKYL